MEREEVRTTLKKILLKRIVSRFRFMSVAEARALKKSCLIPSQPGKVEKQGEGEEGEEAIKTPLPEELVEMILARVPFPFIFKARVLSKSWLARLSSISSQDDQQKKRLAVSFQKQVLECSPNWNTFGPVGIRKNEVMAFDRSTSTWPRIPSLSFLPGDLFRGRITYVGDACEVPDALQLDGALMLIIDYKQTRNLIYVANILTQRWKQVPPRPLLGVGDEGFSKLYEHTKLVSLSPETYKVITMRWESAGRCVVQIYDSTSDAWSNKKLIVSLRYSLRSVPALPVYLDGLLYMRVSTHFSGRERHTPYLKVLAVNLREETVEEFNLTYIGDTPFTRGSMACPLIWNGNLLITVFHRRTTNWTYRYRFMRIDLGTRQLCEVAHGSPRPFVSISSFAPCCYGDCIFLGAEFEGHRFLAYDMGEDSWNSFPLPDDKDDSQFPTPKNGGNERDDGEFRIPQCGGSFRGAQFCHYQWVSSPFQPGLNPFAEP